MACAGGGALSKAEFVAQAGAICEASATRVEGVTRTAPTDFASLADQADEVARISEETVEEIRALDAPEADEAEVGAILDKFDEAIAATRELADAARAEDEEGVRAAARRLGEVTAEGQELARDYGLGACTGEEEDAETPAAEAPAAEAPSEEEAAALAAAAGCRAVEEPPDEGVEHVEAPPEYRNVPASSGPHSASPLPAEVSVYTEPADAEFEWRAVHNLEHGYVLIYYRAEGEGALPPDVVAALSDLTAAEPEVILAPYPDLPAGDNLTLVAWNRVQRCAVEGGPEEVAQAARGFIGQFRNATSPEPQAP